MKRRNHIGLNHFEKSNWLPAKNRVDQFIVTTAYNSKYNLSPVDLRFETWNDWDKNIKTSTPQNSFKHVLKDSS